MLNNNNNNYLTWKRFIFYLFLNLVPGDDVHGLNFFFEVTGDHVFDIFTRDLIVFDDHDDLELLDTEGDGDELVGTPEETVLFDGLELLGEFFEVLFGFPRLDVHEDGGLGDDFLLGLLLGFSGGLVGVLLGLLGGSFFFSFFTEEIHIVVVVSLLGGSSSSGGGLLGGGGGGLLGRVDDGGAFGLVVRGHLGGPLDDGGVVAEHFSEELGIFAGGSESSDVGLVGEATVDFLDVHIDG